MIRFPAPIVAKTQRYGATRSKAAHRTAEANKKAFLASVAKTHVIEQPATPAQAS